MSDVEYPDELDVVAAIRTLARTVHRTVGDDERRAEAIAHIQAATELLGDGPTRARWYESTTDSAERVHAGTRQLSTFSGSLNPLAPPMTIRAETLADGRAALIGVVRLDRMREGPPRSVHGGVLAGLFDELLGGAQQLDGGTAGVTGRLVVRYRRPTPLDTDLELRAWIHDERRRRVVVRGECVLAGPDGVEVVTAEAEAFFLRVDFDRLEAGMRGDDR